MRELIKEFEQDGLDVKVYVDGGEYGSHWFRDLYTESPHIGGVTVQVPSQQQHRDCPKFYIGQYTPGQLASEYAKQGRENPSKEAYESLQKELGWYLTAADYNLVCEVSKAGIELAEVYGITFDYSWEYADESLEEYAVKWMLPDYGDEVVGEAVKEAKEALRNLCAA